MAQASNTTCAHNYNGAIPPGVTLPCRGCGADIQGTVRAGSKATTVINAAYPGDRASSHQSWAFSR